MSTTTLEQKLIPIRKAVRQAYAEMPKKFSAFKLVEKVRQNRQTAMTFDSSILRRLRELRESGDCPYKVVDSLNSIYEKA